MNEPPVALSIAGSDSGGGAGIQADLKAMARLGVHGTTAITALTAQNSVGVNGISPVSPSFLREQVESVVFDFSVEATKTGMLFSEELMDVVIDVRDQLGSLVVDPVMVAESGDSLFDEGAERTLVEGLLPLADIITPNWTESRVITDYLGVTTADDPADRGRLIADALDGPSVLMKGGHTGEEKAVDYLVGSDGHVEPYEQPRLDTNNTHGSGCVYSSLITGGLAHGRSIPESVSLAKDILTEALRESYAPGSGPGTLDLLTTSAEEDEVL